ncbi:MAG: RNA polymerase sigma factor, partial [Limisphaerales bacterium]
MAPSGIDLESGFSPDRGDGPGFPDTSVPDGGPESDAEIVAAVRRGQVERFEELVCRHQPRVFATARRHARLEREVEDIVQEVFVKAYHKLDTWRGEAPFEHWLMRLAVRTCYDHLRSHQRSREDSSGGGQELDLLATGLGIGPAEGISTDAAASKALVDAVLDRLPPAHRLVLTLLELEE